MAGKTITSRIFSGAKSITLAAFLIAALPSLSGCIPLVLTAASVTAIDVSLDRRTPGKYWDDNALELKVRSDIGTDAALEGVNVSVTAFNGVVLLTGQVANDQQRVRAKELVERYKENGEVSVVVNELTLAGRTNISSRLNDSWVTGKVKLALLKAPEFPASAVKVVTEHGKVYLLGRVTRAEGDEAVAAISGISGVTHIVKVFVYTD